MSELDVTVVVPTVGRPSLQVLVDALAAGRGPLPRAIVVVDDRPVSRRKGIGPIPLDIPSRLADIVVVLRGRACGPAAARNTGWRHAASTYASEWIAFLDDDVVPDRTWLQDLAEDLAAAGDDIAGSQGRVRVPLPDGRPPTDWERRTAALASARWITADMAYRRAALLEVAGFDERFPRAYREDADLALRVQARGHRLVMGARRVSHPVRPGRASASIADQRGNADDALMRALHGPHWRSRARALKGRRGRHIGTTGLGVAALALTAARHPRAGALAGLAWLASTAVFAWERIAPGPRTPREIATMTVTSALIPPVATSWWLAGVARRRRAAPWPSRPVAVLFDRDGTLVRDVPYNRDPAAVVPVPLARAAMDLLRRHGVPAGVVTNQSGIARGVMSAADVNAVNNRVAEMLGGLTVFGVCPHGPDNGCACRKPAPGLLEDVAARLGADPRHCVVIGDIGADVEAALGAGARPILVPTAVTRADEVAAAPHVADNLLDAVTLALRPGFVGGLA